MEAARTWHWPDKAYFGGIMETDARPNFPVFGINGEEKTQPAPASGGDWIEQAAARRPEEQIISIGGQGPAAIEAKFRAAVASANPKLLMAIDARAHACKVVAGWQSALSELQEMISRAKNRWLTIPAHPLEVGREQDRVREARELRAMEIQMSEGREFLRIAQTEVAEAEHLVEGLQAGTL
jgi:hypothetical protein